MALVGLVLHASRCGSTLLLRGLECWPGVTGVNEPPELDEALTAARRGGDASAVGEVLTGLGAAGERVVVKTDAWHVLELELLLSSAPVPWLFVHRDPAEILVSHATEPGSHTVPGLLDPVWFGPPDTVLPLPYAADVLARIYAAAAEHVTDTSLVDHADLGPDELSRAAGHFGLDPADVGRVGLDRVLAHHSKRPYESYVDDRADKRSRITPAIAALALDRVQPAYEHLLARARGRAA